MIILLLVSQVMILIYWDKDDLEITALGGPCVKSPTRIVFEDTPYGGMWYDNFTDMDQVSSISNAYLIDDGISLNKVIYFMEDFESYQHGQSLFGLNGWIEDTGRPLSTGLHQFTACSMGPSPMPSKIVGEVYNPDSSYSFILSGPIDVTSGIISCWFSTDKIWLGTSGASSGMISLMKSTSATPSDDDRVVGLIVRNGGIAYRTTPTSTSVDIISSGITANTWYRFLIQFDCFTDKASIYIFDASDVLLGSASNIDFISAASSIGRVELFTNRDHDGAYTTTFWDDIVLADNSPEKGTVISDVITLPEGMKWSTLRIHKEEYEGTEISLELLDESFNKIDGFFYDPLDDEIDLSALNEIDAGKIRLKTEMTPSGLKSPLLKGWGVEWNRSDCFRDTFLTSLKISSSTNVVLKEARACMAGTLAIMESETIKLPSESYWGTFRNDAGYHTPSELTFDLIHANNGEVISGYSDISSKSFDLSGLDPKTNESIRLRAKFSSFLPADIYLDSWSIDWHPNTPPEIIDVTYNRSILRNSTTTISIEVDDPQQSDHTLELEVMTRPINAGIWGGNYLSEPYFDDAKKRWCVEISPPISAQTVNYSLRILATDYFNERSEMIVEDAFCILNNRPTIPEISFLPDVVGTEDDILVKFIRPSVDVESLILVYTYRWFVNDMELENERSVDLWENYPPTLSSKYFAKNDLVECWVTSSDGESSSDPFKYGTMIGNTRPYLFRDLPKSVEIAEDSVGSLLIRIFDHIRDPDLDNLTVTARNQENLTITVHPNGSVFAVPGEDWNGKEIINFTVADGLEEYSFDLKVIVLPVNDPPFGSIIQPAIEQEIEVGDSINLEASVGDVEAQEEELTVTWEINGTHAATGISASLIFEDPGQFNISCHVYDGEFNVTVGVVRITVIDTTPLYVKEDFSRAYPSLWGPVLFDVVDIQGKIEGIRYGEDPGLNILVMKSELVGDQVRITMSLEGPPLISDPAQYLKATYYVYFVKQTWNEPDLDPFDLAPGHTESILPQKGQYYHIGNYLSLGFLSYDNLSNTLGSPKVQGQTITWTLPMDLFGASGVPMEDYNLYGAVVYESQTYNMVTRGFDTIGHGSKDHDTSGLRTEDQGGFTDFLWVLIIACSVAVSLIGSFILILLLVLRNRRNKVNQPTPTEVGPNNILPERLTGAYSDFPAGQNGQSFPVLCPEDPIPPNDHSPEQSSQMQPIMEAGEDRPDLVGPNDDGIRQGPFQDRIEQEPSESSLSGPDPPEEKSSLEVPVPRENIQN